MNSPDRQLAVLFADIAGSTRLYEQIGDTAALAAISRCLELAEKTASGYGGRLVKTIGDEALLVFAQADHAAEAAGEIQRRMEETAAADDLRLGFRIGIHFGAAIAVSGDVFGDSVNVAARMVGLAKRGQVILSSPTAEILSPWLRGRVRELDVLTVKGKDKDIGICELLWQDSSADLTAMAARPTVRIAHLELRQGERVFALDASSPALAVGRDAQNDVVIADRLASRLHARIERRRDKFVLVDQSSNGTFVTIDGEREIQLRREEMILRGSGRLSFGHGHDPAQGESLEFACRDAGP
ncbi:MAG: adenylate/guanylate cyclase domain-containing protein [Betaproteobacteria bacterium]|jgi:class 3 adenylate cyclase|nr:adenylate/guanylate cyclase domain-containing protein [Betaproteobacteria bacterium]MBK7081114.1 adenylate/guanylate cyclase domain-containing protein [Betaproteobacteria bacterium]MBK7743620.1 adenylate/guanylate cyclase domain-containing protein [Betaproteobacteria bacterium]MBK8687183.1 adenylate/guanylate cyclase domain-containing protein [Betaproteobacteria bacterium]MBK9702811.1 adenylate/guanylate cyclase domain-containing protein [Betaproteobacteria bacterium]